MKGHRLDSITLDGKHSVALCSDEAFWNCDARLKMLVMLRVQNFFLLRRSISDDNPNCESCNGLIFFLSKDEKKMLVLPFLVLVVCVVRSGDVSADETVRRFSEYTEDRPTFLSPPPPLPTSPRPYEPSVLGFVE